MGYAVSDESIDAEITAFHRIILGKVGGSTWSSALPPFCTSTVPVKRLGEILAFESIPFFDVSDRDQVRALSKRPSREWMRFFDQMSAVLRP
jgi:hypothetical protein